MIKNRILTALAILIIFIPVLFFAPTSIFALLLLVIVAIAAWEWAKLLNFPSKYAILYSAAVSLICLASLILFPRGNVIVFFCWLCAIFFWVIYVPYALYLGARTISFGERLFLMLMGISVLYTCWLGFIFAREQAATYLLSLLAIIWMSDIGAYFIGKALGRHKLAMHISPKKTVEGAIGGLCVALLFAIGLTLSNTLEPTFLGSIIAQHGWGSAVLLVTLCVGAGIIGDLFESLLKRQANVKDSGHFLPGHGGILDRIDALLPAIPLALLLQDLLG